MLLFRLFHLIKLLYSLPPQSLLHDYLTAHSLYFTCLLPTSYLHNRIDPGSFIAVFSFEPFIWNNTLPGKLIII